ncbi:MAG TPA: STAS domain-containing protein [Armatimonadota bacterium]
MQELLTVEERRDGDVAVVAAVGEVDIQTMRPLREAVRRLADDGVRYIIVDLREVGFIDSAGMSVLFAARKAVSEARGQCYVVSRPGAAVRRSLDTIGIERVMPHLESPDDALADLRERVGKPIGLATVG